MNENARKIITALTDYLEENPQARFGQALFNLNINQFAEEKDPSKKDFLLRDIYYDSNERIIARIEGN